MNILTFDIEDWFHILDHKLTQVESQWETFPARIDENVDRILELLSERQLQATFFCLGWIAKRHPNVVKRIASQGQEIATHSHTHQLAYEQSPHEFREDLTCSINTLEDLTGMNIRAYRAPGFSVTHKNPWVFEALYERGIEIDCSVFPSERSHGGFPGFPAQPTLISMGEIKIKEYPINTVRLLGRDIIFSGGGYFRLLPYWVIKRLMSSSNYVMTYFHPRDFDPKQPMIQDLSCLRKFKSYCGLSSAFGKLGRLLDDFEWMDLAAADKVIDWENAPTVLIHTTSQR